MPHPEVSVIVTTFERSQQLSRLLEMLVRQDYPADRFEVIVVDDGGSQPLAPVIARFERNLQLRLLHQENAGPAAGRNAGAAVARGEVLAFIDDDCEPSTGWLSALKTHADSHTDSLLGGRTAPGLPNELCPAAAQLILDIVYECCNTDPANARFFTSNNMALSAAGFRSVGGFNAEYRIASEDRDLCERWWREGRRMVYVPTALVYHSNPLSLAGFVRQCFRYGRGAARFWRDHWWRGLDKAWPYSNLHLNWRGWLLRPWRDEHGFRALMLTLLLLVWQAANLAGFVCEWVFPGR